MTNSASPQTTGLTELKPPAIIDSRAKLIRLWGALQKHTIIAVDTESNSLFSYQERVCLIQVSTLEQDFIIDPLALDIRDIEPLREVFANPDIEKILHAAEYDVMCLRRDFGYTFANLFDTSIAARVLGWENLGLGPLLLEHFGVRSSKQHQRANWGKRPLTPDLIQYAQQDTHYLIPLRNILYHALKLRGRFEEAQELFEEVVHVQWENTAFDPQGFWRINGVRELSPSQRAVLRELYHFRELQARQRDVPPFKVLQDQTLLELAKHQPASRQDLVKIRGISHRQAQGSGKFILSAIQRGMQSEPLPEFPQSDHLPPPEEVQMRYDALHTWRKEKAAARGVSSEIILSREALWELAWNPPQQPELLNDFKHIGPWRRRAYGAELVKLISGLSSQSQ